MLNRVKPAVNENFSLSFDGTMQQRFEDFHRGHPDVYRELVKRAREAARSGHRCGIRMIWERMRWHFYIEMSGDDEYKLNNNYTSRYARLIEDQEPDLRDFFEKRELRSE